ncbi:NAD(+)/NADH kinase [Vulgatibacter sp.]|uniref:NAD(+)/NADH kinase n=1 Tax=Vulgatibacter sp. TaxID=1971226 RepID=UPI0035690D90
MPERHQRVGIIPRKSHPAALEAARQLCSWLGARGREVYLEDSIEGDYAGTRLGAAELRQTIDFLVVLGGDGTLIHAASVLAGKPIPIFGVNMGSLGFMTEIPVSEMLPALEEALEGRYAVSERMKLDAALYRGDGPPLVRQQVLNDVVISKGALARIADLDVSFDGKPVTLYKADGIIVATPTGSTAYSLSAGGPILYPSLDAVVLAPICPHTLTQRPIVVPPDRAIGIVLQSDNGEVFLTLDGQSGLAMERGDRVEVVRSADRVLLVNNPRLDYFSILRAKLRWGLR